MKKAMRFTIWLGLFIVILFSVGMMMTYVNDAIQETGFFGDVKRIKSTPFAEDFIDNEYEWGARHYWYFWMCVLLWVLGVVRVVIWANYYWEDEK